MFICLTINILLDSLNEINNIIKAIAASYGFHHLLMTESVAGVLHDDVFP